MIAREHGRYVLVCDCCGTEVEHFIDFDDVLEFENREGWTSQRGVNIELEDDWMDICDKCSENTFEANVINAIRRIWGT